MIFGKKDGMFYVNSGEGISRDWVESHIPTANAQGAVSAEYIQESLELEEKQIGGTIFGNVAIRKYVENEFGYKKARANQIVNDMDFLKYWKNIRWTQTSSVDTFMNGHKEQAKKAHSSELTKARTKRWPKK